VPIAENPSLVLCAIAGLAGTMAIDLRSAALTVAVAAPLSAPEVAVMLTVPRSLPVTSPLTVIEATLMDDELQTTVPVISCVLLSENVPVAVNCCKVPSGMSALTGVTLMEVRVALVTVRIALWETAPEVAVMVEVPGVNPIARPCAPFTLMPTTEGFDELQVTRPVAFSVVPLVRVPVAVNCRVVPRAMEALVEERANVVIVGALTVRVTLPLTPESVPVIFAVPCAKVVTTPAEAVATFVSDEVQVTLVVRFWLVLLLYSPVAVSWSGRPAATEALARVIWIEVSVGGVVTAEFLVLQAGSNPRHRSAINIWNFFINFSPFDYVRESSSSLQRGVRQSTKR